MSLFTAEELKAYGSQRLAAPSSSQRRKPNVSGLRRLVASALPIVGGALGAVGGSAVAPVLGTAAGGAAGSAVGEALKRRMLGEDITAKGLATEAAFGAIPGIGKVAKMGAGAVKSGSARQAASEFLTTQGRANKTRREVISNGKRIAGLTDEATPSAVTTPSKPSIMSKIKNSGSDLRRSVANPQVRASVGGAQKEAEIAGRVSKVPGLSAKTKYKNLEGEMKTISAKIEPELAKAKGTVDMDDFMAGVRAKAEQSSHFLAGDSLYEKQLSAVLTDIAAKNKGAAKLTGRNFYDYKKGMDMSSVFTKLERGADLNPKEAARLAVWSHMDDVITKAAPSVKELTKEQSLLIQGASGLKKGADKTLGIPLLGIKSQKLEQGVQAGRELVGRGLEKAGGAGSETGSKTLLGKLVKPTTHQGVTRAVGVPLITEPQPQDELDPALQEEAMVDPSAEAGLTETSPDAGIDYEAAAKEALANGDYKAFEAILKLKSEFGAQAGKPLSAEASKVMANANSGLQSLEQLQASIDEEGGVSKATIIPGRGLFGNAGANALGTAEYDTAAKNVVDVITRLRTGAALTESEERFYKSQIPQAFDSPEVRAQKIDLFRDLFSSIANRTGSAGSDLQEAAGL